VRYSIVISLLFVATLSFAQPKIDLNMLKGLSGQGVRFMSTDNSGVVSWIAGLSGSGTANNIAMWTGTNTFGNGPLSTSGTQLTSTQVLRVPNGSLSAVGVQVGALGRGLYSDGTNLNFAVNSNEKLQITPSGRLQMWNSPSTVINGGVEGLNAQYGSTIIQSNTPILSTGFQYSNVFISSNLNSFINGNSNTFLNATFNQIQASNGNIAISNGSNFNTTKLINSIIIGSGCYNAKTIEGSTIFGGLSALNANYISNSVIDGYQAIPNAVSVENSVIFGGFINYNFLGGTQHVIQSVLGNIITLATPLPANFAGATNFQIRVTNGNLSPLVSNTTYVATVLTTTTISINSVTIGALNGSVSIIRNKTDEVDNVIAFNSNFSENNSINLGFASTQILSLADGRYKYDLSQNLSMANDNESFGYSNALGKFRLMKVILPSDTANRWAPKGGYIASSDYNTLNQNLGNADLTLSSNRGIYGNNKSLFFYNLSNFDVGTTSGGKFFGVRNTLTNTNAILFENAGANSTAMQVNSIAASLIIDQSAAGTNVYGAATHLFQSYAGVEFGRFNTNGLTMASGKNIVLSSTSGATGANPISVTQADATYTKYISGTINLTNPALADKEVYFQDVAVTGAAVGDIVVVQQLISWGSSSGVSPSTNGSVHFFGTVKSANLVQIQVLCRGIYFANLGQINFKILK
jgi:hypothetical protein